jgi:hypothetical protein
LKSMNDGNIDSDDIIKHVEQLSAYEMNGRQIRNVITTGRQLALHKKTKLDWECLRHIINVSERFEKYLKEVNENTTDDEWAREQGVR